MLAGWLLLGLPSPAASQGGTVVRVHPAEVTLEPGESANIQVLIDDANELRAFDVLIEYDPGKINLTSPEFGDFLNPGLGWISEDKPLGTINFVRAQEGGSPKTGDGILFSFDVIAKDTPGQSSITLDTAELVVGEDFNLVYPDVENGIINILGDLIDEYHIYLPLILR